MLDTETSPAALSILAAASAIAASSSSSGSGGAHGSAISQQAALSAAQQAASQLPPATAEESFGQLLRLIDPFYEYPIEMEETEASPPAATRELRHGANAYCPVSLLDDKQLVVGREEFSVCFGRHGKGKNKNRHWGYSYRCCSEQCLKAFLQNPDKYTMKEPPTLPPPHVFCLGPSACGKSAVFDRMKPHYNELDIPLISLQKFITDREGPNAIKSDPAQAEANQKIVEDALSVLFSSDAYQAKGFVLEIDGSIVPYLIPERLKEKKLLPNLIVEFDVKKETALARIEKVQARTLLLLLMTAATTTTTMMMMMMMLLLLLLFLACHFFPSSLWLTFRS